MKRGAAGGTSGEAAAAAGELKKNIIINTYGRISDQRAKTNKTGFGMMIIMMMRTIRVDRHFLWSYEEY